MNTTKKINVNYSSLVGLKAELLRKQTEIEDAKAKQQSQPKILKAKPKKKKMKKVKEIDAGYVEIEDVATLKKSRVMLEAKSMLYDKLKKTGGDDSNSYLVDFASKSDETEDETQLETEYDDVNSDPEDDWVEYEDCFGRTRKCLRRDLPQMREKDNLVKGKITKEPPPIEKKREETSEYRVPTIEKEEDIEIMRKKWEAQMEKLADKSDIHYQDILFDEARAHGVGYYAFSQNEEERAKQQESLAKLRKETEQQQKESQELRESKNNIEFKRLKAAMIRHRVRLGMSPELTKEEEDDLRAQIKSRNSSETHEDETSPEAIKAALEKAKCQENRVDNSLIVVQDKIKAFGELIGKRPKWHEMSQEEWVHKRRKDRLGEFAPVYENFRRAGCPGERVRDTRITTKDDDEKDPIKINAAGPEPTDVWETDGPSVGEKKDKERKEEETIEDDSSIHISSLGGAEKVADDKDEDIIGPLPPQPQSSKPATFINTFVPQPMCTAPAKPVLFKRSVPTLPVINFSIPPPPPPPSSSTKLLPVIEPMNGDTVIGEESSDSNDSIIIGPVPPSLINDSPVVSMQSCDPRLINDKDANSLSNILMPATTQLSPTHNYTATATQAPSDSMTIDRKHTSNDVEANLSNSLDATKILAGLKYLRQKFDSAGES